MPRNQLMQTRRERNAALVDVMMLAGSADGQFTPVELRELLARIVERPEFDGTSPEELSTLVESSAARLSGAKKLSDVLTSLRTRLPDHPNRLLAFGLACAVVLADRRASREELGLLKTFQAGLGISEEEVTNLFEAVQAGRPLAEVLGEPVEHLYAETMVLVSAADGEVKEHELIAMLESMAGDPVFRGLSLESAEQHLHEAVQNVATGGITRRLTVLAHGLTTRPQRMKAFQLGVKVAYANGRPSPSELRVLHLLQATFGLADDEVAQLTVEA
jgi:tellurite resistance protein